MTPGLFITFEGIDGCGKTTQLELVKDLLENEGFEVVTTKEPGAGEFGTKIRNILLNEKSAISDKAEMFLFLADRAQHVEMFIKPAVDAGKIVLCDRHTDSTLAYQGFGRGCDVGLLKNLNEIATSGITPDLSLLFDVSFETSSLRVGNQKDRMESAGGEFASKVRKGYLSLAKEFPNRIKIIDAEASVSEVFKNTKMHIMNLLTEKTGA